MKTSPIYDRLKAQGAVYGARYGWERPMLFVPEGVDAVADCTFRRFSWFKYVGQECRAVRDRVGVLDQASFAKFEVPGPDAAPFLERLCANRIGMDIDGILATQMLNEQGGIEYDVTVTRLSEEQYWVITAAALLTHDLAWIQRSFSPDDKVSIRDVTGGYACLTLSGPRSRHVLQKASGDDVSNEGCPFLTCRAIHIGCAPVYAYRISCIGELGWEPYHPIEYQRHVYDLIVEAGPEFGIVNYGYRALDSMRM